MNKCILWQTACRNNHLDSCFDPIMRWLFCVIILQIFANLVGFSTTLKRTKTDLNFQANADVSEECRTYLLSSESFPLTCGCSSISQNSIEAAKKSDEECGIKESSQSKEDICCFWRTMTKTMTWMDDGKINWTAVSEVFSSTEHTKVDGQIEECEDIGS